MKKLFLLSMLSLAALTMQAQRCAVLEFKAGVGISQTDVDGISAIFITYFRPTGYTMVERTQIDKVIEEEGFQRSSMTESQMVRIGEILNVSKIVVGDINIVMGQYNVDARVINVESGTVAATEGATFATGTSYRNGMQSLAQKLAGKIAIKPGATVVAQPAVPPTPKPNPEPIVIYDYLKVFPNDLGTFDAEPQTVINRLNQSQKYGYSSWRLPTEEELALMRAENVIGSGTYMTRNTRRQRGIVRLVTDKETKDTISQFVDLGLPSGTLWKFENEGIGYYSYYDAKKEFGDSLPTLNQWKELMNVCEWRWMGKGFDIIGPNGNNIFLPAPGERDCDGVICCLGETGSYWTYDRNTGTSSSYDTYRIQIYTEDEYNSYGNKTGKLIHKTKTGMERPCNGYAVRLIKNK